MPTLLESSPGVLRFLDLGSDDGGDRSEDIVEAGDGEKGWEYD